ncbi:hypothetical protein DDB_G0293864 [Dictyostelium discoideum AX4]|uniref:Polymerase/histidinol phosphatase N-terminal domain-containing protein n=1 Tax=Dictyostelium discoideum TaxID=44689 RepID=Q54B73_DICDI|nr:hypothetical protein DDB_G0293864 [Dictyostelium discoideum AX4]EAL60503.1 hypothetical protein DDB_G0293864 [Dictyostelium discoideum AX4]|eukprot:XP_628915.1 hypothetical protein DDB_G0293864 [Dictyostelium discoideum AX4]
MNYYQNLNENNQFKYKPNYNYNNNNNKYINNNYKNNNNNLLLKIMKKIKIKILNLIEFLKFNFKKTNFKIIFKQIGIQLLFMCLLFGIIAPISILLYNNSPSKYLGNKIQFSSEDIYSPIENNISIYDRKEFPQQWSQVNILLDPHSHTTYSDGTLTPEENIKWHISNGFNAMFMTDHNKIEGGLEGQRIAQKKYSSKILVVPGIEWTNCRCHLNLIGINVNVPLIKFPTNKEIKEIIDFVHSQGGLVILNHYPWSYWAGLDQPSMEEWYEMGIDFLEVVNIDTMDYQGIVFCKDHDLRYVTGSDFHSNQHAYSWTVFNIPQLPHGSIPTQDQLIKTLLDKSTKTSFAFDSLASKTVSVKSNKLTLNPTFIFLSPWIYIGGFFHSFFELKKGMYSFVDGSCTEQIVDIHTNELVSLVAWIFFIFIIAQLLYFTLIFTLNYLKSKFKNKSKESTTINKEDFEKEKETEIENEKQSSINLDDNCDNCESSGSSSNSSDIISDNSSISSND